MGIVIFNRLNKTIKKNKKVLAFVAITGIVLSAAIFLISILISKNKKPENPFVPVVPVSSNNTSTISDGDIKKTVNPIKPEDKKDSVSDESIKTLNINSEKNKNIQAVSDDVLKGLTVPINK